LDRRLAGLQSWSEHSGEEENFQPLPGLEPPIIQPVAHYLVQNLPKRDNNLPASAVSCGCVTVSLTLRGRHKGQMFIHKQVRKISVP
jgi:hypothetical protein